MSYYSSIIAIQVAAAIVMIFMISSNPIMSVKMKRDFLVEFILLVIVSVTEWLNICLNGYPESYRTIHYIIKVTEFITVPILLAMAIMTFGILKKGKILIATVIVQGIFQLVSVPNGWIFSMDATNTYVRGPFYFCYVAFYSVEIIILVMELLATGRRFQNSNPILLILGALFCVFGIAIQLADSANRTAFLTTEMTFTMCYIYVNNMILQTDKITGLLNRWGYEKKLELINYSTCILIFDIDSFKSINDSFGHQVGDECLKKAADTIRKVFEKEGRCYRIGGDEFCVIIKRFSKYANPNAEERIKALIFRFNQEIRDVRNADPRFTGVSVGYAYTDPELSVHWAVERADKIMYDYKEKNKIEN